IDYNTGITLSTGTYQVIVQREINGSVVNSTPLEFSITYPDIYNITPSSGPIGVPFTITGEGFGNYISGKTNVLFGDTTAYLTLWTDTQIKGTVPGTLLPGEYTIKVKRAINGGEQTSLFTELFEITVPVIESITPSTHAVFGEYTITGQNFGNYVINKTKVLVNDTTSYLTLWTDNQIKGKLPYLTAGSYPLTVERDINDGAIRSNIIYINIIEPYINSINPTGGNPGTEFIIGGTGFGNYISGKTNVLFGDTTAYLTLWRDTQIKGKVPQIPDGTYSIKAERTGTDNQKIHSNTIEYTITGGIGTQSFRSNIGSEFILREVYVFPNPAKRNDKPTFHIECGIANEVNIKIYTVSGRIAYEHTISGLPQIIDDGNGADYAYEWTVMENLPSGVYYYMVEAAKGENKLKSNGKFAVLR
ncbi:MAG: hypothetical protein GX445_01300, partial [Elusimicrobia bacterium]|nr:hypothetical protein [Elusimicrobiota bacterium]